MSRISARMVGGLVLLLSGCVRNPAPHDWLPRPQSAATDVHGAWAVLSLGPAEEIRGELLAVGPDTVYVLRLDGAVMRVPTTRVTRARIGWYESEWRRTATWGVLGTLSTASHGFILVASAPIWIIAGTASTAADSRAPILDPSRSSWADMARYARYPAGPPGGLPQQLPQKTFGDVNRKP
jgi:hypothetical protein